MQNKTQSLPEAKATVVKHERDNEFQDCQTDVNPVEEYFTGLYEEQTFSPLGIVTDCSRLNVRAEPSGTAEIITTIPILTEVSIDINASTDDFYKISTGTGIEGFCMRKYIAVQS